MQILSVILTIQYITTVLIEIIQLWHVMQSCHCHLVDVADGDSGEEDL
jgi:hypothetical protein